MVKKRWIATAISEPGSFTRSAKRAGMGVQEYARAKQHAPGKLGRRARLATTLGRLARRKRR